MGDCREERSVVSESGVMSKSGVRCPGRKREFPPTSYSYAHKTKILIQTSSIRNTTMHNLDFVGQIREDHNIYLHGKPRREYFCLL